MKYIAILAALLIVGGCATKPVPVTAEIPVAVACKVDDPQQPTYRFNPPYTTTFDGVRDLMGDRETSLGYETQLRAALASCK